MSLDAQFLCSTIYQGQKVLPGAYSNTDLQLMLPKANG